MDFLVEYEEEFRIAIIRVVVDGASLRPHERSQLMARLYVASDNLRSAGYRVACDPPIISDDLPLLRPLVSESA